MEREEERLHRAVGKRLFELRDAQEGLTQERLAERSGLHVSFVARAERGETAVTVDSLAALCNALGVTLADFFESLDRPFRVQGPRRKRSKA
jgi:transcriptional regulator with XRE-family HTH domain